ncbi:carbonic anhydrase [Piscirickettsia salmonis]|uniref:carbonic anhydrase n=1 Tax=Piscirickettsia salmonis TaxID=1238 RepID=UPI003A810531
MVLTVSDLSFKILKELTLPLFIERLMKEKSGKNPIVQLILGHKDFKEEYLSEENERYRKEAAQGQHPKVLIISCSDSRVNPVIVNHINLGQVFSIQNVANTVPPYQPGKLGAGSHHGTSAAIEFAVLGLSVEHIIVYGHSGCGGIRSLIEGELPFKPTFVDQWVRILDAAKQNVQRDFPDATVDEQCHHCEREGVKVSLKNLLTFPWVKERVDNHTLQLHGWHFDIPTGDITRFDEKKNIFLKLD